MDRLNRRDVIKMGAAGAGGAALAGLATRGAGPASAAGTRGLHIHGTVTFVSATPGAHSMNGMGGMGGMGGMMTPDYHHVINIDVWGPDSDVSGIGWGATTEPNDLNQPAYPDGLQCIYTQRGSIVGDVVRLKGRMLFSGAPDQGNHILTEANLATGHIRWIGDDLFILEGTGVVMRL
jgi:hypothetical protein